MFCKYCGNQVEDNAIFCSKCGKNMKDFHSESSNQQHTETSAPKPSETMKFMSDKIEKTNPLCIAALVLTILMFFFNYYGIVSYAALIIAFMGFRAVKKSGEKGLMVSIVCMAVAGISSLISVIRIIEYNRYASASYGALGGLLQWFSDLF